MREKKKENKTVLAIVKVVNKKKNPRKRMMKMN